jgi:hypothetical protein
MPNFFSLGAALILGCMAGCASVAVAPADSPLSGTWVLDKAASDNVEAKVSQALASAEDKLRKRRERYGYDTTDSGTAGNGPAAGGRGGRRGGGQGGAGQGGGGQSGTPSGGDSDNFDAPGDEFGSQGMLGPDFAGLRTRLMQALFVPMKLKIEVLAEVVRITPDDVPSRDYHLGEEFSRFDEYGTAKIDSSWKDNAFVLRARYTGASRVERYELTPHSDTLTLTRQVVDPIVGKLNINSVYHRA